MDSENTASKSHKESEQSIESPFSPLNDWKREIPNENSCTRRADWYQQHTLSDLRKQKGGTESDGQTLLSYIAVLFDRITCRITRQE
ncbi:hypothetical protein NPIL_396441 [Nephila pilipes]|uniref:Uncharacterized protein n=1 Tax=Nephila pilipes TaxID=299642 RepID=A0A8X6M7K0_NEPPI|nr:hypothetical protein NPIL_396441 [Nephila pilipes]